MGVVLFLYVGAEFGLGSWVSEYAQRSADASVFGGAALTSGYWGALLIGRLVSGWYFARQSDAGLMLLISIAGAGLASVMLAITTGNIVLSAAAAFCAGLSLGPVWPATVAIASEGGEASAIAATATMGNAGGLVLPWAQGRVLVGSGPAAGVAVTAVLCGLMFGIVSVFRGQRRRALVN
jgi:fucose permease